MKIFNINIKVFILIGIAVLVSFSYFGSTTVLAATTPSLGTADTFGVLVNTFSRLFSGTTITGDLGYTTFSGTGTYTVSGQTHMADSIYNQAGVDQGTALIALNNQACDFTFTSGSGAIDLATDTTHTAYGGALGVYTPGVYCLPAAYGATIGAAGITLSGSGTYIFRINGSLTTAANSVVTLDGASACNVFWTLADNAIISSFGAYSTFFGTLFDTVGLQLHNNVTWTGRAFLTDGSVSISYDDAITAPTSCSTPPPPPPPTPATLHVVKHVINDDGSKEIASDFTLHVKGSGSMGLSDVTGSPAAGVETPGNSYSLTAGTYIISEDDHTGYVSSFSGDCDSSGNVTLISGDNKTCTITNNDIAIPPPQISESATLHVIKIVVNDDGGKAVVSDASIHVMNSLGDVPGSPHSGASLPGTAYSLNAGAYTVSEDFFPGYAIKIGGDCTENGTVNLAPGDDKTCTITNNDITKIIIPPIIVVTTSTPPIVIPPTCDICSKLTYDVYIINPDGTEKHTGTSWVRVTDRGNGIKRYSFEDATLDPHNPLYDYNDSVIDVDYKDCKSTKFMFVSSDASWKHQVKIKVSIDGVTQSDTLVASDSKAVVGTLKTINATTGVNSKVACSKVLSTSPALMGKILLQVQAHGEAWYINPKNGLRYYLANGDKAYNAMRNFGVGITNSNLAKIKASKTLAKKSSGKIFLQVESHGEAYYIDFNGVAHYLKDGAAAYEIMRSLGLGITNNDLNKITIGNN